MHTMDFLHAFGRRVSDLRREKGLSRQELARRAGISLRFLAAVEGGTGNLSLQNLAKLSRALGVPPAGLLAGIGQSGNTGHTHTAGDQRWNLQEAILSLLQQCDVEQLAEVHQWLTSLLNQRKQLIALIGLRGAGKTTIGKKLARKLRWRFVELDERIEKAAGLTLQNIFEVHGEEYYRRLEHQVLLNLILEQKRAVIATGGGIVMRNETYELLQRNCRIIWLRAKPEDHWSRVLQQDPRPMTNYPDAFGQLQSLLQRREPLYSRADSVVNTSELGIQGSVQQIVSDWSSEL
jgi:XRE family transcriptional regulator, aerobic/anaerobic benzoate catabolism transcriptional regulator